MTLLRSLLPLPYFLVSDKRLAKYPDGRTKGIALEPNATEQLIWPPASALSGLLFCLVGFAWRFDRPLPAYKVLIAEVSHLRAIKARSLLLPAED